MTGLEKLKRDLATVQRALKRDQHGYDEDGYDSEDRDRYGRSRELMERSAKYQQMAFDSLTQDQQALVMKANSIYQKYIEQAVEWENQPQQIKEQASFYDEYQAHSPITKHSFLIGLWITKEEDKVCGESFDVMVEARKKVDPYYWRKTHA